MSHWLEFFVLTLLVACDPYYAVPTSLAVGDIDLTDDTAGPAVPVPLDDDGSGVAIYPAPGDHPAGEMPWIVSPTIGFSCLADPLPGNDLVEPYEILLSGDGASIGSEYTNHCADWTCTDEDGVVLRTWTWRIGSCETEPDR